MMTQADIDRLEAQARTYDRILDDIEANGEEYPGEREFFEEELTNVNAQLNKLIKEDNEAEARQANEAGLVGWLPF